MLLEAVMGVRQHRVSLATIFFPVTSSVKPCELICRSEPRWGVAFGFGLL